MRDRFSTPDREEDQVLGEYTPGGQLDDPDDSFAARLLYAFWRLCEQRIAQVSAAGANHSATLLAERAGVSSDVRIVELRSVRSGVGDADVGGREWHHRWPVRMHRVRQWYPSEQRHKVIYRGPYIKGPADRPLLGGEVVRGLTR